MANDSERHDRLIGETYHGDWADGPASSFAQNAARHARRLRRRQQALAGVAGAVLLMAVTAMLFPRAAAPSRPVVAPKIEVAAKAVAPAYEIISDQELLAEVRDRPLLAMRDSDDKMKVIVLAN